MLDLHEGILGLFAESSERHPFKLSVWDARAAGLSTYRAQYDDTRPAAQLAAKNARLRARRALARPTTCPCGNTMQAKSSMRKWCNDRCRKRAHIIKGLFLAGKLEDAASNPFLQVLCRPVGDPQGPRNPVRNRSRGRAK